MKRQIKIIIAITVIICLIFYKNSENSEDIMTVDIISAEKTSIINQIIAKGNIEEQNKSYVSINQNGVVEKINFALGDKVSKGDVILKIKTNNLQSNHSNTSIIDLIDNKNITILDTKNLGEIEIISNVDGIITAIPSVENESILSGVPFLSICNLENLIARVEISEKNIKQTKVGQDVILTGDAFYGNIYGEIIQIMPYVTTNFDILSNSSTVLVEALVKLKNLKSDIIVGCSVEGKITIDEKKEAITVPYDAIYQEKLQEYVYIVQENIVIKREITTGYEILDKVEVLNGLSSGDKIITTKGVFEGQLVNYEQ